MVAITGDDYVNSRIASAITETDQQREGLRLLVQVEDPALSRFLEQEVDEALDDPEQDPPRQTESPAHPDASKQLIRHSLRKTKRAVSLSSFSANAIAADELLDHIGSPGHDDPKTPGREIEVVEHKHLLLAGDHPLLDAIVLAGLRGMRTKTLWDREEADVSDSMKRWRVLRRR